MLKMMMAQPLVDFAPLSDDDYSDDEILVDAFSGDEFRMYEFKIRRCNRGRSHDWTDCPFAHPGEKARRRDPRKFHYSGVPCPEFRKGSCKRGDGCEFAHGVFECWLHPSRYRTQPCKDGTACRRRVCFFAHTPEQLRLVSSQGCCGKFLASVESYDGSPMRKAAMLSSSPKSTLMSPPISPTSDSPPISPFRRGSWPSRNEIVESLRQLQLGKVTSSPMGNWLGVGNGVFGSPTAGYSAGFLSLPTTPTGVNGLGGGGWFEDGVAEERVESGRALRAKMFEKLSKDVVVDNSTTAEVAAAAPDVGWISDLVM